MRCYHLGNMYLSPIQQGIQAAHAQMELFVKYRQPSKVRDSLYEWATDHKTMICLNAGCNVHIQEWFDFLKEHEHDYAWSTFYEEVGSVSHVETLTNVAIVLPEKIYAASMTNEAIDVALLQPVSFVWDDYSYNQFELLLIQKLRRCRLA